MTKDLTGIDPVSLGREMRGKSDYPDSPGKGPRQRKVRPPRHGIAAKTPTAPAKASVVGEDWHQRGVAFGFDLPYDANWFANRLQERVDTDPRFQRLVAEGREDDGWRLVAKMSEVWWRDYASIGSEVTRKNAADFFLRVDWEDCQDYALSSLRARYLREHGKPVQALAVSPEEVQAHQERLAQIQGDKQVNQYLREMEDVEPVEVDSSKADRLRSFVKRRREARSEK